ncbi:hypothetical protein D3C81_375590 [compost metagenome]
MTDKLFTPNMPATQSTTDVPESLKKVVASAARELFSIFPRDFLGDHSPYNFATITGVREGIEYSEMWVLVNAYYDPDSQRFKRVNVENFSFGWQWMGGGTYPGEASFGDTINQGMNLWKANGKKAYAVGDPIRDATEEDIGVMVDGEWKVYGMMQGWMNAFMVDSYGGMTIGGNGFEVDGAGTFPYIRLSLGKFSGKSDVIGKPYDDYGFAYMGFLWNAYHGLFDSDQKLSNSFLFGMQSPINFYDGEGGVFNPTSNRASMDDVKLVWKKRTAGEPHTVEHWHNVFEVSDDGTINTLQGKVSIPKMYPATITGTDFNITYPDASFTKNNTVVLGVIGFTADGTKKQQANLNVIFTDFGMYGSLGNEFVSASLLLGKY